MKYVRMFLLHFQEAFNKRGRSFVWFLISLYNPLLLLVFWIGAYAQKDFSLSSWSLSAITSYYFLLIIAASFLDVHIEEDVAVLDIREGGLAKYLIRPVSYYWIKFFEEIGHRITQGVFGIIVFFIFFLLFGNLVTLAHSFPIIVLSIVVIILGYFLSFTFKMIVGLTAFWFTDFWGLQQLVGVVILVMAGFVMPLELYPVVLRDLAYILPFSYMIYFPIVAVQGQLGLLESFRVITMQGVWFLVFIAIYQILWRNGVRKFTAIGL